MKAVLCLFVLSVVVATLMSPLQASPVAALEQEQEPQADHEVEVAVEEGRADRHRRVTCDLLSVSTPWGGLNHAACAANCLRMGKGYRGGRCIDGVCNCRK